MKKAIAALALTAFALVGCTGKAGGYSDEQKELFVNNIVETGTDRATAECIVNWLSERYDVAEIDNVNEDVVQSQAIVTRAVRESGCF
jgi:hypothetical protein